MEHMEHKSYFHRVSAQTPTQFWVNNPTREEADLALAAGVLGCTTNPSFCQKMVDHPLEGPYALALLDEAVRESRTDSEAQAILQRKLVRGIADKFRPLYEGSRGKHGFVSIQGDPIHEHDPNQILEEGLANRELGENICIKVPVTRPGLKAIEGLVRQNIPVNSTEIFAVAQATALCELYKRTCEKTRRHPRMYLSHIAGIYDDFLKQYADEHRIDITSDLLWQAGLAVARKVYGLVEERGYKVTFIGGGARGLHHFTEMVGGDLVVTINWVGTADRLLEEDPPVVYRVFNPVPKQVIDELNAKLPDFRRGYAARGLSVDEFGEFGPVELFRSSFIKSWERVLKLAGERRAALGLSK
jgi:transaldolase